MILDDDCSRTCLLFIQNKAEQSFADCCAVMPQALEWYVQERQHKRTPFFNNSLRKIAARSRHGEQMICTGIELPGGCKAWIVLVL